MTNDGFWHRAWQFALLFAVIAMLAASIVVQNGDLSSADVREILAEEESPAARSSRPPTRVTRASCPS